MAVDCKISLWYLPGGCLGLPATAVEKDLMLHFCFFTEMPFSLRLIYDGDWAVSYITRNFRKEKIVG
jgi:hypothetical protein